MQIKWTNCADEMPPDDKTKIIAIFIPNGGHMINHGYILNNVLKIINCTSQKHQWKWAPFTPEKWEYLNK